MKVYLSHDRSDAGKKSAATLSETLIRAGLEPVAADAPGPSVGSDWQQALEQQLDNSDAFVFVVDPDSERSQWIQREWSAAAEQSWASPEKPMIPVVVGDVEVPPFLRNRQIIRVPQSGGWGDAASRLLVALQGNGETAAARQQLTEQVRAEQQQRFTEIATAAATLASSNADREADVKYLEAQLARLASGKPRPEQIGELEVKLADALKALQRNDEATIHLQKALHAYGGMPGEKGRDVDRRLARIQANLGRLLQATGKREEARDHWKSALALYNNLEGADSVMVASTHAILASLNKELGDSRAADDQWKAAFSNAGGALQKFLKGLPLVGGFIDKLSARGDEPVTKAGGKKSAPKDKVP